ncbi:hypothetical protein [Poseidonibacter antarcticus]|nr:hypothetical protein [Poseidonibacter antarcticus]
MKMLGNKSEEYEQEYKKPYESKSDIENKAPNLDEIPDKIPF